MRTVRTRFVCLGDGAIGTFINDPDNMVYTYKAEIETWELRATHCPTMLINMEDVCPAIDLPDHEFRTYNEHIVQKLLRRTRGDGVLTIIHRGWQWHFGLAWSRKPLVPKFNTTDKPPRWWNAEDLWCEGTTFEELEARLEKQRYAYDSQWQRMSNIVHNTIAEARGVLGEDADDHDVQNFARELRGEDPVPRPPPPDLNAQARFKAGLGCSVAPTVAQRMYDFSHGFAGRSLGGGDQPSSRAKL